MVTSAELDVAHDSASPADVRGRRGQVCPDRRRGYTRVTVRNGTSATAATAAARPAGRGAPRRPRRAVVERAGVALGLGRVRVHLLPGLAAAARTGPAHGGAVGTEGGSVAQQAARQHRGTVASVCMALPNASYSITVRLEVPHRPGRGRPADHRGRDRRRGGDGAGRDREPPRPDRRSTSPAPPADQAHAERDRRRRSARWTSVTVRKVSDRTFLLHLGGKIEVRSKVPLRTRDDLSMAYTPGVARVCLAIAEQPGGRPAADDQAQHGRGRHRRLGGARAGQPRPGRRAAGDGGQVRAVQALRRHRRLADLPRHPGRRRDRPHRAAARAGVRRHQPRGHRRPALLRGRGAAARACWTSRCSTTTSTAPRSWCWPRC